MSIYSIHLTYGILYCFFSLPLDFTANSGVSGQHYFTEEENFDQLPHIHPLMFIRELNKSI